MVRLIKKLKFIVVGEPGAHAGPKSEFWSPRSSACSNGLTTLVQTRHAVVALLFVVLILPACTNFEPVPTENVVSTGGSNDYPDDDGWKWIEDPGELGWNENRFTKVYQQAKAAGTDALLVIDHGMIVAGWGDIDQPYELRSIRKSLVNPLIGQAIDRGALALDETLLDLDLEERSGLTEQESSATLEHLLNSTSGVYLPAAKETSHARETRPARGAHAPGEFFYYNNWGFNVLGTIYQEATGRPLFAGFQDHVATPLGMQDYELEQMGYQGQESYTFPAYVFRLSARDLARVGLLFLREGRWKDKQIVSGKWVRQSTSRQARNEGPGYSAYGRLWWVVPADGEGSIRGRYFFSEGSRGQFLWVVPERNLVVVHLAESEFGLPFLIPKWLGRFDDPSDAWGVLSTIVEAAPSPSAPPDQGKAGSQK